MNKPTTLEETKKQKKTRPCMGRTLKFTAKQPKVACRIKPTEAGHTRNLQQPKESKARRMRIVDGKTKLVVHPRHLKAPMVEQTWDLHVVVDSRL
jgi:hypothetical protein